MSVIQKYLQQLFRKKPIPASNFTNKKSFEERKNELGVFTYDSEGFSIELKGGPEYLKWSDITEINVFKKDLYVYDEIDMEIIYGEWAILITEEIPGWFQFVLKTKSVFPSIPKEWDLEIVHPAFATNWRNIYNKNQEPENPN